MNEEVKFEGVIDGASAAPVTPITMETVMQETKPENVRAVQSSVARSLPTLRIQVPQPMKHAKLSPVQTDTVRIIFGKDKGVGANATIIIKDPELERLNNVTFCSCSIVLNPLMGFATSDRRRDKVGQPKIRSEILAKLRGLRRRGRALALVPVENVSISQLGTVVWPVNQEDVKKLNSPVSESSLVTPVKRAMLELAKDWLYQAAQFAFDNGLPMPSGYELQSAGTKREEYKLPSTTELMIPSTILNGWWKRDAGQSVNFMLNELQRSVSLDGIFYANPTSLNALELESTTVSWDWLLENDNLIDEDPFYYSNGEWYLALKSVYAAQENAQPTIMNSPRAIKLAPYSASPLAALLKTAGLLIAYNNVHDYSQRRQQSGAKSAMFGGLHTSVELGVPMAVDGVWDSKSRISPIISDSYFILPYDIEEEPEGVVRIRDYLLAEALSRLVPGSVWRYREIGHLPETAEEIEAWQHGSFVHVSANPEKTQQVQAAWNVFTSQIYPYITRGMDAMQYEDVINDPRMDIIRAWNWLSEFIKHAKDADHWTVFNGQILHGDAISTGFIDDTVYKLKKWLTILRKYLMPSAEEIRLAPTIIGQPDTIIQELDEWCDAIDDVLEVIAEIPEKRMQYGAFSRNLIVRSQMLDRFTLLGQDVVFRLPYYGPADLDKHIQLPKGASVQYIRPQTLDYGGIDSMYRMSVNAQPQRKNEYGLVGDTLIRSQRSAAEQIQTWYYVPLRSHMESSVFDRIYNILTTGALPSTYLGTEFRPWRTHAREGGWLYELMARTNVGRISSLMNSQGGLGALGIAGLFFPVTTGSCNGGMIEHLFINNSFAVDVKSRNDDATIDKEVPLMVDMAGAYPREYEGRFDISCPDTPQYAVAREVAKE